MRKKVWIIATLLWVCLIFRAALAFASPIENDLYEVEGLVRVRDVDPSIIVDLRYATVHNFTGRKIYPATIGVLKKETAVKLARANQEFIKIGYRIKVWDAYRPWEVQQILWDMVPDSRYVANPGTGGSRHNRGGAVDVTLVDINGQEIIMPSEFDDFSPRASRYNTGMSDKARSNMEMLSRIMQDNGFKGIDSELWHFDDTDVYTFPVLDVKLEEFQIPAVLNTLPINSAQAAIVEEKYRGGSAATLSTWERRAEGWVRLQKNIDTTLGRNGLAPPGEKREGDSRTPSGIYALGDAFGYKTVIDTKIHYRQVNEDDYWVDDPNSVHYNTWVQGIPQAASFEHMKRQDHLYKIGIVIEYNTNPVVPGQGSAIFLHIWRKPGASTTGCVALSEEQMVQLLQWLDPLKQPVIILGKDALVDSINI
jgi:zinc D-Ala-D-Ala dipeptidase